LGAFWYRVPWFVFLSGHLFFMYMLLILTHLWSIFASKLVHLGSFFCNFTTEWLRGFAGSFCDVSFVVSGGFDVADTLVKKEKTIRATMESVRWLVR
jgi:hypothetical protein